MSTTAIIIIAIAAVVVLAAITLLTAARKSDVRGAGALSRETRKRDRDADIDRPIAEPVGRSFESQAVEARAAALAPKVDTTPAIFVKPDADAIDVSRRQFLNRATVTLMSASLLTFLAGGFLAFLWPFKTAGFGGKVSAGKMDDIIAGIRSGKGFLYNSTARSYLTAYPAEALPKAKGIAAYKPVMGGMEKGLVALWQKCPHLGCRVPQCESSQWFECPCHGSQYNRVGEKKGGPAPRGMDHFLVVVSDSGDVTIDTATPFSGAPIGTNTTGQEAEGPHCVSGGHH